MVHSSGVSIESVYIACLNSQQALAGGQAEASSVQCQARARTRLSRGRAIIPGMSSRRCCQRGLALRPCPRSDSPQLAPAEAGEAPS
eukprot:scaffold5330_cov125-Isochrysis_galbana.AAC.9